MTRDLLTDFELMILLAILRVGEGAYGVLIAREIERTGGRGAPCWEPCTPRSTGWNGTGSWRPPSAIPRPERGGPREALLPGDPRRCSTP